MRKVKLGELTTRGVVTLVPTEGDETPIGFEVPLRGPAQPVSAAYRVIYHKTAPERYAEDFGSLVSESPQGDLAPYARAALRRATNHSITSGTDPEIFAFSPSGKVIPAWDYLPHKDQPLDNGYASLAYWDGVQAEVSFTEAYTCHETMTSRVRNALKTLHQALRKLDPTAELAPQDTARLGPSILRDALPEHIDLGCSPSLNAYGSEPINIPDARKLALRFAGCHTHFGATGAPPPWFPDGTVVMMDKVAGTLLTALGRGLEDPERRRYYGRSGEYRLPKAAPGSFRLEYRTPSNFLLWSPGIFNLGFDICRAAFQLGLIYDGREFPLLDAQHLIQTCDADAAVATINSQESFFSTLLRTIYGDSHGPLVTRTLEVLRKGFKPASKLATAWNLASDSSWTPPGWASSSHL